MTFELRGLDAVERRLSQLAADVPQLAAAALFQEAEIEMAEAKARTPVDTGALRNSGHVQLPEIDGRDITVRLGFGGPSVQYALIVHENLEAFHPVGQAKYLESTLTESAPHLASRVARRIDHLAVGA